MGIHLGGPFARNGANRLQVHKEEHIKSYIVIDNRKILVLDGATRTLHDDICEVNPVIDVLSYRDFLAVTGGICEAHVVRNGKILDVGEIQGRIGQCVDNTIDLGLI